MVLLTNSTNRSRSSEGEAAEAEFVDEESALLLGTKSQDQEYLSTRSSNNDDDNNNNNGNPSSQHQQNRPPVTHLTSFGSHTSEVSVLSRRWTDYNESLEKRPLLVKSLTAFLVLGLGDAVAQIVEHIKGTTAVGGGAGWDYLRTCRFGVFGFVGTPWAHYFYFVLDDVLPPTQEALTCTTFLKVFIDQFLQAPLLLALIIIGLDAMQAKAWGYIQQDLEHHYWGSLVANWKLWLPASFVNIAFIQPRLRVFFDNMVFFVWTIILSILLHS